MTIRNKDNLIPHTMNPLHGVESSIPLTTYLGSRGIHYMELKGPVSCLPERSSLHTNPLHGVERRGYRGVDRSRAYEDESITWN
jgi:hypothetical protein